MKEFNCGYHDIETIKKISSGIYACKQKCPVNTDKVCYRWSVCYMAKYFNDRKVSE